MIASMLCADVSALELKAGTKPSVPIATILPLPAGDTNYIQNSTARQTPAPATLNVDSGTVDNLSASTAIVTNGNLYVRATPDTQLAPAISAANWFVSGGWESPIVGGVLNKNVDGTGVAQMLSAPTLTIGTSYRIDLTFSGFTTGSVYFDAGGYTTSGIPASANGTITYYFIATSASGNIFFHPTNTSRFVINSISFSAFKANSGKAVIDGNLIVRSKIQDAAGVDTLFLNNGNLGIQSSNPTSALTIGTNGSVQVDRAGSYNIKNTAGTVVPAVTMGATNILSFINDSGLGEALYGTTNGSANPGNIAFQVKGNYAIFLPGAGSGAKIGFGGNLSPTAILHPKAGTAAAESAPFKLNSGPLMTTPEAGAMEFLNDNPYWSITNGPAASLRKGFVLDNGSTAPATSVLFSTTNGRVMGSSSFTYTYETGTLAAPRMTPFQLSITSPMAQDSSYLMQISSRSDQYAVGVSTLNHFTIGGGSPTISSCGVVPAGSMIAGADNGGTIQIGGGAVISCTLTFGIPYKNLPGNPTCNVNDNSTAVSANPTSITNTTLTIGLSGVFGGGLIFYHCDGIRE